MTVSGPLVCHHCWPTKENWHGPCPHAMAVYEQGKRSGPSEPPVFSVEGAGPWNMLGLNEWCVRFLEYSLLLTRVNGQERLRVLHHDKVLYDSRAAASVGATFGLIAERDAQWTAFIQRMVDEVRAATLEQPSPNGYGLRDTMSELWLTGYGPDDSGADTSRWGPVSMAKRFETRAAAEREWRPKTIVAPLPPKEGT